MGKPRKWLKLPEEDFFALALMVYGRPDKAVRRYIGSNHFSRGAQAYLIHNPKGQVFMKLIVDNGEAKGRAGFWYYKFLRWYEKEVKS